MSDDKSLCKEIRIKIILSFFYLISIEAGTDRVADKKKRTGVRTTLSSVGNEVGRWRWRSGTGDGVEGQRTRGEPWCRAQRRQVWKIWG